VTHWQRMQRSLSGRWGGVLLEAITWDTVAKYRVE
jgi:hypothetical protein